MVPVFVTMLLHPYEILRRYSQANGATAMSACQLMPRLGSSISGKEGPGSQGTEQADKIQGTLSIPGHPQLAVSNLV